MDVRHVTGEGRMKLFDPNEACPKCGTLGPGLKWEVTSRPVKPSDILPPESFEVLRVTCWRCGFCWYRAPLDASISDSVETE
jgi:hypothetical protein